MNACPTFSIFSRGGLLGLAPAPVLTVLRRRGSALTSAFVFSLSGTAARMPAAARAFFSRAAGSFSRRAIGAAQRFIGRILSVQFAVQLLKQRPSARRNLGGVARGAISEMPLVTALVRRLRLRRSNGCAAGPVPGRFGDWPPPS